LNFDFSAICLSGECPNCALTRCFIWVLRQRKTCWQWYKRHGSLYSGSVGTW